MTKTFPDWLNLQRPLVSNYPTFTSESTADKELEKLKKMSVYLPDGALDVCLVFPHPFRTSSRDTALTDLT